MAAQHLAQPASSVPALAAAWLLCSLLLPAGADANAVVCPKTELGEPAPSVQVPLSGLPFSVKVPIELEFRPLPSTCSSSWLPSQGPAPLGYSEAAYSISTSRGTMLQQGTVSFLDDKGNFKKSFTFDDVVLTRETFEAGEGVAVRVEVPDQCHNCTQGAEAAYAEAAWSPSFVNPWVTVLPPLVTLGVAVGCRNVLVALVAGCWAGATILNKYNLFVGFLRVFDTYVVNAVADSGHASVIVFSLFLGGLVALLQFSGGAQGLATSIAQFAKNSYTASIVGWALGLFIFFDDYSNCLIVGNSYRAVSDHMRISREKLAFLVDCTAAPIASVAPISSWIGFELGLIQSSLKEIGLTDKSPYMYFMSTIPSRFYPIAALFVGFVLVTTGRDFGPMHKAEMRARTTGQVVKAKKEGEQGAGASESISEPTDVGIRPKEGVAHRWYNAMVPLLCVVLTVAIGLWLDGMSTLRNEGESDLSLQNCIANGNSFRVLIYSSVVGLLVPALMYKAQGIASLKESLGVWVEGQKMLVEPLLVLILAWSLGSVVTDSGLANFVVTGVPEGISVGLLPAIIFLVAGVISLTTGSSWGTMAVMFPLAIPLAWDVSDHHEDAVVKAMSAILAGAVFGDHCTPISDTTILTCLACRCPVDDHVATQMPYAILAAVAAVLLGYLPNGFGLGAVWCILMVLVLVGSVCRLLGKPVPVYEPGASKSISGVSDADPADSEGCSNGSTVDVI